MRKVKIGALVVVGLLVALVVAVFVVGSLLPEDHVATRTVSFKAAPEPVYDAIADFEHYPAWRAGVTKEERLPDRDGKPVWRETNGFGVVTYAITEAARPGRLVSTIADPDLPFGGTWTYEIVAEGTGSKVTITERGVVKSAPFRFMSRFVFGYTATMDAVLKDLGKKLGE
jgi:uncharacterized protein YndB with AHSA1/START domain